MLPTIAINGRFLTQPMTGVQRFAVEVIKAIDELIDNGEFAALKGQIEVLTPTGAREFPLKHIAIRQCGVGSGYFWEQVEFPLYAFRKLLLNLCILGPLVTRRQIVVVHDATVRALPWNFSPRFRAVYNFLIPALCRRSRLAVTVSQFSRREIGKWYGLDVSRMPVCFEGGDHLINVTPDCSILDRLDLGNRRFFLAVGVGSNKNLDNLIDAFQRAQLPDTALVLTGRRYSWNGGSFNGTNLAGVVQAGHVSDAELRALYERALALTFPSRYEGFGLPPLEAMTCGCPVIISNQPALVEVAGDAALQCDPDDTAKLAHLMRQIHDDTALRARMIEAGRARSAQFTWRSTARILLGLCLQVDGAQGQSATANPMVPRTRESFKSS
jgi:glycosyltransferase involved in cell wall biosynthesis